MPKPFHVTGTIDHVAGTYHVAATNEIASPRHMQHATCNMPHVTGGNV